MNYDFINNDETIIIEGKASKTIFLGFNSGGSLILTNQRLIFKGLFSSKLDEIPISMITFVGDTVNILIPSKNMIKIHTKNGEEYQFLVTKEQKELWKQYLNALINNLDLNSVSTLVEPSNLQSSNDLVNTNIDTTSIKSRKKIVIPIVIGVVIALGIVGIFVETETPVYKQTEIDYYNALYSLDAKKIYSMLPDDYVDYLKDTQDMSKKDIIECMELVFEQEKEEFDGIDTSKPITFLSIEDADTSDMYLDDNYWLLASVDLDISQVKYIELQFDEKFIDYCIKVDDNWYSANSLLLVEGSVLYKSANDIDEAFDDFLNDWDNWDLDDGDLYDDNSNNDYSNDDGSNIYDDIDSNDDDDDGYDFDWDY